jgi:hypothetical protein
MRARCKAYSKRSAPLSSAQTGSARFMKDDKYALDYAMDDEKITSMKFLCFNRHIGFDDVYR